MSARGPLIALVLCTTALAAEQVRVIDAFDYADPDAARQQWVQRSEMPAVDVVAQGQTGPAMKIPCPFGSVDKDRNYVDRSVTLDLSAVSEVLLDVFVSDPPASTRLTLYFRSGPGWFGRSFGLKPGWNTLRAGKAGFGPEDTPTGWHAIDAVRISPWRTRPVDGYCLVDNLRVRSHDVLVVAGTAAVARGSSEARSIVGYADAMVEALKAVGLATGSVDDFDVERGALKKAKLAIFPYNPVLTDGEVEAIRAFVGRGGKIFVFYSLSDAIAEVLGIKRTDWVKRQYPGHFAEIRFRAPGVQGLPERVKQASWNVTVAEPVAKGARAIGRWFDAEGKGLGLPAVLMSETGVFMGHVLLSDDAALKRHMLLAWIGHYYPETWGEAVAAALAKAGATGPLRDMAELESFIQGRAGQARRGREAQAALARANALLSEAKAQTGRGDHVGAIATARRAGEAAAGAYRLCHGSRKAEFRAVWNHSGYGAWPGDWPKAMANLAKGGFNAVVPNMWWGGVAHYKSDYLPASETYKNHGDQIEQCVAAAKAYGIEVHPWKVNWNLGRSPQSFVDQLAREGRLQVDAKGEQTKWLCPSNPKNYQLELDTMVEVAQKYDVDGVHFDYIRYPGRNGCYCEGCRERFQKQIGRAVGNWPADVLSGECKDEWTEFRCAQITRLVKATAEGVRAVKPYCKISAAVFRGYPNCRAGVGQDWVKWVREGYLDFVCPMDYIRNDAAFAQTLADQMRHIAGRVPFYPGIGVTLRYTKTPEEAIHQVELSRQAGTDGFIIFNYSEALASECVPAMGEAILAEPAIHPHQAPPVTFRLPAVETEASHVLAAAGESIHVEALVAGMGRHRQPAKAVTARLQLEDIAGRVLDVYGSITGVGQTASAEVARREGALRLAVAGTLTFEDGSKRAFVARSRPFQFSPAE